jgi:hypothetical protein
MSPYSFILGYKMFCYMNVIHPDERSPEVWQIPCK